MAKHLRLHRPGVGSCAPEQLEAERNGEAVARAAREPNRMSMGNKSGK